MLKRREQMERLKFGTNGSRLIHRLVVLLLFFLIVTFFNWGGRYQQPVWDTAAGVFAPAIYLYESGFDFPALFKAPGFTEAGPNVHVITPITPITAMVMKVFEGNREAVYFTLHIIQFFLAGALLSMVFWLTRYEFGWVASIATVAAVFFFPPFSVQTGYLYMELGGSLCVFATYAYWVRRKYGPAAVAAFAACTIKSFGLPIALALIFLFLLERGDRIKRLRYVVALGISCLGVESLRWFQGTNMTPTASEDYVAYLVGQFYYRLLHTPDLLILILIILIGGSWYFFRNFGNITKGFVLGTANELEASQRLVLGAFFLVLFYVGFLGAVPLSGMVFYPLTRYYVWIWPVIVVGVFGLTFCFGQNRNINAQQSHLSVRISITLIGLLLSGFFFMNRNGKFYPNYGGSITAFSIAERSMEYKSFNTMQAGLLAAAERIDEVAVYLNLFDTYYTSNPLMGYVENHKGNFRNIVTYHQKQSDINEYPDEFFLVFSNVGHGGQYMSELIERARRDPNSYRVRVIETINVDGFQGSLVEIVRLS